MFVICLLKNKYMKHIFKRNQTYYYRVIIPKILQKYFTKKTLYIKSLKTTNKNDAIILVNYLDSKLNYIKSQTMLLNTNEIQSLVSEFEDANIKNIINRNSHLTIAQINSELEYYANNNITHEDPFIKTEVASLLFLLNKNGVDTLFDTDTDDINLIIDNIVQIKINALNELKNKLSETIYKDITTNNIHTIDNNNNIKLDVAIAEFVKSKKSDSKYRFYLNMLLEYCNKNKIYDVINIKHNIIIKFRDTYLVKKYPNKNSLNQVLTHLVTFFNYCIKCEYINNVNPAQGAKFKLSTNDKVKNKRQKYSDDDIKKILDINNINKFKTNQKTKLLKKYASEYEVIIKIAMFSGLRANEIVQLTKSDIVLKDNIYCFDINAEGNKDTKNDYSVRLVPIHSKILNLVLNYIKNKSKNLFKITQKQLTKDYSLYKKSLGFNTQYVFHSFRHSFTNKLKQSEVSANIIDELTGHAQDSAMSMQRYSNKYNINILKEAIENVAY